MSFLKVNIPMGPTQRLKNLNNTSIPRILCAPPGHIPLPSETIFLTRNSTN